MRRCFSLVAVHPPTLALVTAAAAGTANAWAVALPRDTATFYWASVRPAAALTAALLAAVAPLRLWHDAHAACHALRFLARGTDGTLLHAATAFFSTDVHYCWQLVVEHGAAALLTAAPFMPRVGVYVWVARRT